MLDQVVHVLQIAGLTALPFAHGHLVLAKLVEILRHARVVVWRCWHGAVGVFTERIIVFQWWDGDGRWRRRGRALVETQALAWACCILIWRRLHVAALSALDVFGEVVRGVV
jgi:hypothetical protein